MIYQPDIPGFPSDVISQSIRIYEFCPAHQDVSPLFVPPLPHSNAEHGKDTSIYDMVSEQSLPVLNNDDDDFHDPELEVDHPFTMKKINLKIGKPENVFRKNVVVTGCP